MTEEMPVADHRDMYSIVIGWLAQISSQTAFFNLKESKSCFIHGFPGGSSSTLRKKEKEEEKIVRSTRWLNILPPN